MNYPNVEALLSHLGLWKAVRGIPAMSAVVIIFIAICFTALRAIPVFSDLPSQQFYLGVVVAGTVLALIGYFLGDFWDATVFDPLYGLNGRWVNRSTRPFGLFPAGDDMDRVRAEAAAKLVPNSPGGKGVYRAAVGTVRKRKGEWENIEQPLILSKFLRAFIWPSGLACLALVVNVIWQKGVGDRGPGLAWAATLAVVFVLLFVPYVNLRVEHMQRLYEHVSRPKVR